ncbi:MAG: OmpA family protein [Bacteroidota bacterium]
MMSIFRFLFFFLFSMIILCAKGQNAYKLYRKAEETFFDERFGEAVPIYKAILKLDSQYEDVPYKLEIAQLLSDRQYTDMSNFLAFEETMSEKDKFYYYWKGRVLLEEYQFEEAIVSLNKFVKRPERKKSSIINETKKWIEEAKTAKTLFDNPENYEVYLLPQGVNTSTAELSPVFFADKEELLFLSNRNEKRPKEFQIYHTKHKGNRVWTSPSIVNNVGTFTRENANIEVVDEDGRLFQFRKNKGGDLYYSEPTDSKDGWSEPKEFDSKITSTHLSSHFFINEHEDRILFAKEVGNKKEPNLDLYESFLDPKSGKWSKPLVFAPNINSNFNEDSPFLSADEKTLYFASDGHETMGGYDIFKCEYDESESRWSEPVNLGFPINSPDDEIHIKLNPDQRSGYFTSNRLNTYGDYDIFFFWEISTIKIKGRVLDGTTGKPITAARIFFRPIEYTDLYYFSEIKENGAYSTQITSDDIFKIEVKFEDNSIIKLEELEIHETGGASTTYIKDFYVGDVKKNIVSSNRQKNVTTITKAEDKPVLNRPSIDVSNTKIQKEVRYNDEIQIKDIEQLESLGKKAMAQNIYFEFDDTEIKRESLPILNRLLQLLQSSPNLKIEIAGHADNIGSNQINKIVSQKRAESVKKWLVQKGIDANRILARGYGKELPLATNDDEFEGRELNRRIEIIVR